MKHHLDYLTEPMARALKMLREPGAYAMWTDGECVIHGRGSRTRVQRRTLNALVARRVVIRRDFPGGFEYTARPNARHLRFTVRAAVSLHGSAR